VRFIGSMHCRLGSVTTPRCLSVGTLPRTAVCRLTINHRSAVWGCIAGHCCMCLLRHFRLLLSWQSSCSLLLSGSATCGLWPGGPTELHALQPQCIGDSCQRLRGLDGVSIGWRACRFIAAVLGGALQLYDLQLMVTASCKSYGSWALPSHAFQAMLAASSSQHHSNTLPGYLPWAAAPSHWGLRAGMLHRVGISSTTYLQSQDG
jgi:hypothetical protein